MITPIQQLSEQDWLRLCDATMAAIDTIRDTHPLVDRQILAQAIFHMMTNGLGLTHDDIAVLLLEMYGYYRIGQPAAVVSEG